MKHYRAFGLALSLVCLLAAPQSFAGGADKDEKDKHSDKPTPKPKTHGIPSSGSSSSSSHSHGNSSDSGKTSNTSHDYARSSSSDRVTHTSEREHHVIAEETRRNLDSIDRHPGSRERIVARDRTRLEISRFQGHVFAPLRFHRTDTVFLTHVRIIPTTYYYRRTAFYNAYGWRPAVYFYGFAPRYGLWDAMFLAFALDHIAEDQYALMLYHHRHDAEIERWMDDSDRLAEENDELRAKIENMKLQMARLEEQGVPVDASYVPPDAQDVALSPEVITALTTSK
jgi:hypothetical protein